MSSGMKKKIKGHIDFRLRGCCDLCIALFFHFFLSHRGFTHNCKCQILKIQQTIKSQTCAICKNLAKIPIIKKGNIEMWNFKRNKNMVPKQIQLLFSKNENVNCNHSCIRFTFDANLMFVHNKYNAVFVDTHIHETISNSITC